ncbi:MAG: glycosyltransferase family 39 protein [Ignavibacteriae bacterium]|nr:glycosyltransferase family 39 protein [Ignavibacteriota bacterium]
MITIGNFKNPEMYEHGYIARNLNQGYGYTMHWPYPPFSLEKINIQNSPPKFEGAFIPPVDPYIIYLTFQVFGDNGTAYAILMILNSIFSTIGVFLVYLIIKYISNIKAARIGALFGAIFVPNIFGITTFSGSALYQTTALAFIFLLLISLNKQKSYLFMLTGLTGGFLTLQRSEFLVIGLGMIIISLFIKNSNKNKFLIPSTSSKNIVIVFISFLIIATPWVVRNTMLFNHFTTIVSHPWHEFWRGNNNLSSGGDYNIYGEKKWINHKRYPIVVARMDSLPFNQNFEVAVDSILKDEALTYIKNNPVRTLITWAKRFLFVWTIDIYTPRTRHPINVLFVMLSVIPCFIGLNSLYKSNKMNRNYNSLIVFLSFMTFYTLLFTVVNLIARYQIYLLTVCQPLTGIGLYEILKKFKILKNEN